MTEFRAFFSEPLRYDISRRRALVSALTLLPALRIVRAQEQTATLSGWGVTNYYRDGIIRIAEGVGPDDCFCFVREDGSCGPVKTWRAVFAETDLRQIGVEVRWAG